MANISSIVPVKSVWPEGGERTDKRIKSPARSRMKKDLLNALLRMSMNGPPVHCTKANINYQGY